MSVGSRGSPPSPRRAPAVLLVLLAPSPALAGPPVEVGVYAGGTLLSGDTGLGNPFYADQQPRSSFTLGLRGGWLFHPRLSAEAELDYTPTSTVGALSSGRPGVAATLFGSHVSARYLALPHRPLRPFLVAGASLALYVAEAPEHYALGSPDLDVGVHWGLGVEYDLGDSAYALRVDLRQTLFPNQDRTHLVHALNVGVVFDLLGEARRVRQPSPAASVPGPASGNAGEDVAQAEPGSAPPTAPCASATGRPGCGELGSDTAEADPVAPLEGIGFASESAEIRPSAASPLDRAVAVLLEHPELRLEVAGHTDTSGAERLNTQLSRRRADAVKWYLVDRGIAPARIVTVGLGPTQPVASNDDADGRARNRRIELRLLGPGETHSP